MLKSIKYLYIICICCVSFLYVAQASYLETKADTLLLQSIDKKLSKLSYEELKNIDKKLLDRITRYDYETRLWYMIHELQDMVSDRHKSLVPIIWITYTNNGFTNFPYVSRFVVRAGLDQKQWIAKNPVLTYTIPDWYCIEKADKSLPDDFTKYSKDAGETWENWSENLITKRTKFHPIACNITHVKVIYPEDMSIFDISKWYTAAMNLALRPKDEKFSYPFCVGVLVSADNVQYEEDRICVTRPPEERRDVVWTFWN